MSFDTPTKLAVLVRSKPCAEEWQVRSLSKIELVDFQIDVADFQMEMKTSSAEHQRCAGQLKTVLHRRCAATRNTGEADTKMTVKQRRDNDITFRHHARGVMGPA